MSRVVLRDAKALAQWQRNRRTLSLPVRAMGRALVQVAFATREAP